MHFEQRATDGGREDEGIDASLIRTSQLDVILN